MMNDKIRIAFLTSGGMGSIFVQMNFIYCFWTKMKDEQVEIIVYGHKSKEFNDFVMKKCKFISEYYGYERRSECYKYDAAAELILYPVIIFENNIIKNKSVKLHEIICDWKCFLEGTMYRKYVAEYPFCDYYTYQYASINNKNCLSIYDIKNNFEMTNSFKWKLEVEEDNMIIQSLGLKTNEYITIQRGATPGIDASSSPKLWSENNYEELIRILHIIYPRKKIVQLGEKSNSIELKGVDMSLLSNPGLITPPVRTTETVLPV